MNLKQIIATAIILIITTIEVLCGSEGKSICGRRLVHHETLITHGVESIAGSWPWHAAIFHVETNQNIAYKCGGSVITSNAILTAAHCVYEHCRPIVPDRVLIELGRHNLKINSDNTKQFEAFKIIPHPNYNKNNENNDIAIIRLSTDATFNNYVQPICLWDSHKKDLSDIIGKNGRVIGWGITETDKISYILREAVMPVVSLATCLESNRPFFGNFLSENNFCAGFRNGTGVCNGDSGGSMAFEDNGVYSIRGIVSLASAKDSGNLCNTNEYVVFTDVAKYLPWIEKMVPNLDSVLDPSAVKNVVACEESLLEIGCEPEYVISVLRANYGRKSKKCNMDGSAPILTEYCFASNSKTIVDNFCSGKESCSIAASNTIFGDPCGGTYKYLEVDYQCVPKPETKTAVACEASLLDIECEPEYVISVLRANYGRISKKCNLDGQAPILTEYCFAHNSKEIVDNYCSGKQSCSIEASHTIFGDPCYGTYKYLEVDYQCI